ncbi:MAG: L,D-transpeptidase family protein [Candidatus Marinimicrobia bacterium]|nr:L,D-transpeptidase family protein [Candidatus Neomarinimicrobiota bacterium]
MNHSTHSFHQKIDKIVSRSNKTLKLVWIFSSILVLAIMFVLYLLINSEGNPIPDTSKQLIVVVTPSWEASKGSLYRFEREETVSDWKMTGQPVPVILGRNGLGWGRGLHQIHEGSNLIKREGDGKSPAGVFRLGEAFGFPTLEEMGDLKIPYRPVTDYLECVDDVESQYYTKLVERDKVEIADWESSERIYRSPNAYHYGVMVEHNTVDTQKGAGSCIILHCVSITGDSTAGCTTMDRTEMEKLVYWLDAAADPLLVQLPLPVYKRLKQDWKLPNL